VRPMIVRVQPERVHELGDALVDVALAHPHDAEGGVSRLVVRRKPQGALEMGGCLRSFACRSRTEARFACASAERGSSAIARS
jgi:hypothetical protein